jgi:uncharacterized protein (TIGR00661 family)
MNILYAIQGTGNGHFSRAKEFIPYLQNHGNLQIMVSGTNADVDLGHPIRWHKPGISYTFGRDGGIDYWDTLRNLQPVSFLDDVREFPIQEFDLIISDYEPVSAWAARHAKLPCIGLSHQSSFLSPLSPRPSDPSPATEWLFRYYAPCTYPVGFHYRPYDTFIHTPIIRSEVRSLTPRNDGHITVYLPAYADEILIPQFQQLSSIQWHVFSKHCRSPYEAGNVSIQPVNNEAYLKSLESCHGVISGGGFEAPAESLFLGKQLLIIPMRDQYEQRCNAEALRREGIRIVDTIDDLFYIHIGAWLDNPVYPDLAFPDESAKIIDKVLQMTKKKAG